jgi:lysophospholipase L1-like esterase
MVPGRIVCLGDSLTTNHCIENDSLSYPNRLRSSLNFGTVINAGKDADRVKGMLSRLKTDIFPLEPGLIIIMGGINDIADGRSERYVVRKLDRLYSKASSFGGEVLAITILPALPFIDRDGEETRRIVNDWISSQNIAKVVDGASALCASDDDGRLNPEYDMGDHIHINAKGTDALSRVVFRNIVNSGSFTHLSLQRLSYTELSSES